MLVLDVERGEGGLRDPIAPTELGTLLLGGFGERRRWLFIAAT